MFKVTDVTGCKKHDPAAFLSPAPYFLLGTLKSGLCTAGFHLPAQNIDFVADFLHDVNPDTLLNHELRATDSCVVGH
jgi:hypothetical protein